MSCATSPSPGCELSALTRVEVKTKANAYALERDGKQAWRVTRPVPLAAETATLNGLVTQLDAVAALAFPTDSPEERRRDGLESPAVDATFTLEGGGAVRVRMARAQVDAMEKGFALREDKDGALLAEVPLKALAILDKPASELRDRTVLAFAEPRVHRLVFTPAAGGPDVVVDKEQTPDAGGDGWVVKAPTPGPAKRWKLSSVLWTLGSLKAAAFGEVPKDWSRYGVTDKSRAVTLLDEKGAVLARLQFGRDVPGKPSTAYVRGTQPQVMELDTSRLSDLPSVVDDVLDAPPTDVRERATQQLLGPR